MSVKWSKLSTGEYYSNNVSADKIYDVARYAIVKMDRNWCIFIFDDEEVCYKLLIPIEHNSLKSNVGNTVISGMMSMDTGIFSTFKNAKDIVEIINSSNKSIHSELE